VGGFPGTALVIFSASTEDDKATLTKKSYMNNFFEQGIVKVNDVVLVSSEKNASGVYAVITKKPMLQNPLKLV
jgi:hypothetical protein